MIDEETKARLQLAPRFSWRLPALLLAGALGLATGLAACSSGAPEFAVDAPVPAGTAAADEVTAGSVGLELDVAGVPISTFNYTILGAGFQKSGSLDVSQSTHLSAVIAGIPLGTNYVVTLSGASSGTPATSCEGSASFNVTSTSLVSVPVNVTCRQQKVVAAAPVPLPPAAIGLLCLALLGAGVLLQRRTISE